MKILLVGPGSDFVGQVRAGLAAEGHAVRYIDERGLRAWPFLWRVVRHIRPLRRLSNALLGRRIQGVARSWQPELVLVCKGTTIKEPTLRALRSMRIATANWFPENGSNEPYRSWLDRSIGLYDYFFSFDSALLQRTPVPGTKLVWLPLAVDPDVFAGGALSDADHRKYDCDVCFVGAWYPEREQLLTTLNGMDVRIFGWSGWEHSSLASLYHGPLDARESAKAYRCAKIVLNMNLEPPVNGVNLKTFEICAAGGFQLTDFRADLPKLFVEGDEVAVFHSPGELAESVRRYLGDHAERQRIARAGQQRVLRDHTAQVRVRTIIATIT